MNFVPLPVSRKSQDRPFTSSTKIEKTFDGIVDLSLLDFRCAADACFQI
ncbi:MAG: hypothetical protein WCH35_17570 [Comamonadaceae bacterium]